MLPEPFHPPHTVLAACLTTLTTRAPADFHGLTVPEVLQQGNHVEIRRWRRQRAIEKTFRNRPELLDKAHLSADDKHFLRTLQANL